MFALAFLACRMVAGFARHAFIFITVLRVTFIPIFAGYGDFYTTRGFALVVAVQHLVEDLR